MANLSPYHDSGVDSGRESTDGIPRVKEETQMTNVPPNTGANSGVGHDRGAPTGTPRWVKLFGIVALVLILLFVVIQLSGRGGDHGPGNHVPSGAAADDTLASEGYEHSTAAGSSTGADDLVHALRVTAFETTTLKPGRIGMAQGAMITSVVTTTAGAVPEFTLGDVSRGPTNGTLPARRTT